MYKIGDKIVYPMHGAGIIEQIEQKVILGERREYYVLRVPCGDMKIMIPVDKSDEIGVRSVISAEEMNEVLAILRGESTEMSANWNRRYRENTDKLKTGDAKEVAEVLRNLLRTDREKTLSTGEKKMLSSARQILVSEMILASDLDPAEADKLIGSTV
jgi:CarD family transcriptional regulator